MDKIIKPGLATVMDRSTGKRIPITQSPKKNFNYVGKSLGAVKLS